MKLEKICNRAIEYSFYSLFFLVPLIMTPWNYELFEFNKMLLVYVLTAIIAGAWLIKIVINRRIIFRRTPLDIPLLVFLIFQILSFLFSIDRHTSLWGYYGRFQGGLLSTISYIILYYAFVSNSWDLTKNANNLPNSRTSQKFRDFRENKLSFTVNCLRISLVAGFLVAGYGILEHFGIDAQYWVQDVKTRVFSTLGQPNWLAAYLAILIPITFAFALNSKHEAQNPKQYLNSNVQNSKRFKLLGFRILNLFRILNFELARNQALLIFELARNQALLIFEFRISTILSLVFYLCLLYTRSRSGFAGFWLANIIFTILSLSSTIRPGLIIKQLKLISRSGYRIIIPQAGILKKLAFLNFLLIFITFIIGSPFPLINRYFSLDSFRQVILRQSPPSPFSPPTSALEGGTESGEIRKIVWKGAIDIWKHYPLFGSGVETFAYSYYQFRPKEHNLTSEWDFLYNKAHNEYLNYLATTGILGLGSYLLLIGWFLIWTLKKTWEVGNGKWDTEVGTFDTLKNGESNLTSRKSEYPTSKSKTSHLALLTSLIAAYISILITNFFGFSVVPVALYFYLIPAISFVLLSSPQGVNSRQPLRLVETWQWLTLAAILIFTFYILHFTFRLWLADFSFNRGRSFNRAADYSTAFPFLEKAAGLVPGEPVFHDELAYNLASLALLASEQEMASPAASESRRASLSANLTNQAVKESDFALQISPYNLNFWKNRAKIFYTLGQLDPKYLESAEKALSAAADLAPTDAKVSYNLGLILGRLGKTEEAIGTLKKTLELKPDYRDAQIALDLFTKEKQKNK